MTRIIFALAVVTSLSTGAIAAAPACPTLAESRAAARDLARTGGYSVTDLDGPAARKLEADQGIPAPEAADHVTILTNRKAGRSVALVANGRCGGFGEVDVIFSPALSPIDSARLYLEGN